MNKIVLSLIIATLSTGAMLFAQTNNQNQLNIAIANALKEHNAVPAHLNVLTPAQQDLENNLNNLQTSFTGNAGLVQDFIQNVLANVNGQGTDTMLASGTIKALNSVLNNASDKQQAVTQISSFMTGFNKLNSVPGQKHEFMTVVGTVLQNNPALATLSQPIADNLKAYNNVPVDPSKETKATYTPVNGAITDSVYRNKQSPQGSTLNVR